MCPSQAVHPAHMERALELAALGRGRVEPNPMVGCVIVAGESLIAEGWHRQFGGPHAEVNALRAAGERARGATLYVTLEPCCHHGKTPPCTDAIINAGIRRVVVAQEDPFAKVAGGGITQLRNAGIDVEVGLLGDQARLLNAPYRTLLLQGRPWVIAKWAMTLDGKIAAHTGHSRWISSPASRQRVHDIRGCVDAILVGSHTAKRDDPLLTVRPPGPRVPARIVLDHGALLPLDSQLVTTISQAPVIVLTTAAAATDRVSALRGAGCQVLTCAAATNHEQLQWLLTQLGQRRMTNILVEGGATVLGTLFDAQLIDEVHVFVAPKLVGGRSATPALAGNGLPAIPELSNIVDPVVEILGPDVYISGRVRYN